MMTRVYNTDFYYPCLWVTNDCTTELACNDQWMPPKLFIWQDRMEYQIFSCRSPSFSSKAKRRNVFLQFDAIQVHRILKLVGCLTIWHQGTPCSLHFFLRGCSLHLKPVNKWMLTGLPMLDYRTSLNR